MSGRLFIQSLDEFNYTSSVNFFDKTDDETSVICLPGFEIMFYNFDKIITSKIQHSEGLLLSSDNKLKEEFGKLLKNEASTYNDIILSQSDLNTNNKHIYEFMFGSLAKDMAERQSELYMPKKNDYDNVKEKLSGIDKKIVTINGRNLGGDRVYRNASMEGLIRFLLIKGYYVVNCTLPNPGLKATINHDSYIEVPELDLCDYSKNISYFLNSHCLISISNSAGITNHICTKSNIILYGQGGWVDNPKFGHNNKSLLQISSEIKPTYMTSNHEEIDAILKSLEKPDNINFFNESKII